MNEGVWIITMLMTCDREYYLLNKHSNIYKLSDNIYMNGRFKIKKS